MRTETKRTVVLAVGAFIVGGILWSLLVPNLFVMRKAAPRPAGNFMGYTDAKGGFGGGGAAAIAIGS